MRGPQGSLETSEPVAVVLNFEVTHPREHLFDGADTFQGGVGIEPLNYHVADNGGLTSFRVRFDDEGTLVFVQLIRMDGIKFKVGKVTHKESFNFVGHKVDDMPDTFNSFMRHFDSHKGKDRPPDHDDFVFQDALLTITATLNPI